MRPPIYQPHISTLYNVSGDQNRMLNTHNPMTPLPKQGPTRNDYIMFGNPDLRQEYQKAYLGAVMTDFEENTYYSAENRGLALQNQYYKPIERQTNYAVPNYLGISDTTTIYPDINTGQVKAHIKFV